MRVTSLKHLDVLLVHSLDHIQDGAANHEGTVLEWRGRGEDGVRQRQGKNELVIIMIQCSKEETDQDNHYFVKSTVLQVS